MLPLKIVPTPYRLLAGLLAVLLILAAVFFVGRELGAGKVQARWDKARAEQFQAALDADRLAREKEQSMNQKLQEAQRAATEREIQLRADYAAAHAAARGLRDTVSALRGQLASASPDACRVTADAALAVFSECSSEYTEMAAAADGHASDVRKLTDAWPK